MSEFGPEFVPEEQMEIAKRRDHLKLLQGGKSGVVQPSLSSMSKEEALSFLIQEHNNFMDGEGYSPLPELDK